LVEHCSLSHFDFGNVSQLAWPGQCSWLGLATAAALTLANVFSAMIVAGVLWFCLFMRFVAAMLLVGAHKPAARAGSA
jgi:hypothetical protein